MRYETQSHILRLLVSPIDLAHRMMFPRLHAINTVAVIASVPVCRVRFGLGRCAGITHFFGLGRCAGITHFFGRPRHAAGRTVLFSLRSSKGMA